MNLLRNTKEVYYSKHLFENFVLKYLAKRYFMLPGTANPNAKFPFQNSPIVGGITGLLVMK